MTAQPLFAIPARQHQKRQFRLAALESAAVALNQGEVVIKTPQAAGLLLFLPEAAQGPVAGLRAEILPAQLFRFIGLHPLLQQRLEAHQLRCMGRAIDGELTQQRINAEDVQLQPAAALLGTPAGHIELG